MKMLFLLYAFALSHPVPGSEPLVSLSYGIHPVDSCDAVSALPVLDSARSQITADFPEATVTDFGFECVEVPLAPQRGA